jgi:hypothetical protein
MAANRKTDPLEVTQVILVALREEEKRRREGLRVGAGFVFLAAGLFIVLVVGLMNSWEATYMLIVALVVSIALFVVGQALGILLAEFAAASSRLNTALDSLIAQKEAASGNQDNGKAEGKESKPAAGGAAETVPAREAGRPQ